MKTRPRTADSAPRSAPRNLLLTALLLFAAACAPDPAQPGAAPPPQQDAPDKPTPPGADTPPTQPDTTTPPARADLPEGAVPAALVGIWSDGVSSPSTFWDQGQYAGNAREQAIIFAFDGRGTYGQYVYNAVNSYGCWLKTWSLFEGTAVAQDATLSLHPARGRYQIRSNCNAGSNVDREATPEEVAAMESAWSWQVEGRTLSLWKEGWEEPYSLEQHE